MFTDFPDKIFDKTQFLVSLIIFLNRVQQSFEYLDCTLQGYKGTY